MISSSSESCKPFFLAILHERRYFVCSQRACASDLVHVSDFTCLFPYCLLQTAVSSFTAPLIILESPPSYLAHFKIPGLANAAAFHITKGPSSLPREGNYLLSLRDTNISSCREVPTEFVHAGADLNQF